MAGEGTTVTADLDRANVARIGLVRPLGLDLRCVRADVASYETRNGVGVPGDGHLRNGRTRAGRRRREP